MQTRSQKTRGKPQKTAITSRGEEKMINRTRISGGAKKRILLRRLVI